jgi:protein-S-isoprenylcysteine O-methyltransferase Ste14
VLAASLWLLWRSHADLGRNWSPTLQIVQEQRLITEGVYGRIRHPIYAAIWLWGIAQALLPHNWIAGLAGLALFLPVYLYRMPREEQIMAEHFGEAYHAYASRTGRVLPRIGA